MEGPDGEVVIGTGECLAISKVLRSSPIIREKWSLVALSLGIDLDTVDKWKQNLVLDKDTLDDVIFRLVLTWLAVKGSETNAIDLIRVCENECKEHRVGDDLRRMFNLPKSHQSRLSKTENQNSSKISPSWSTSLTSMSPPQEDDDIATLHTGILKEQLKNRLQQVRTSQDSPRSSVPSSSTLPPTSMDIHHQFNTSHISTLQMVNEIERNVMEQLNKW